MFFLYYYIICFIYCIIVVSKRWNQDSNNAGLYINPELDILGLAFICIFVAPVDLFHTVYKKLKNRLT